MALTKAERDALPDSQFAFPRTRQNPMHDEKHVKMSWDMVDTTKGVTDSERHEARQRILRRAKELGMDTSEWSKLEALAIESIEAMSLGTPTGEHPNRMPFSGILVRVDHVSELAPHGSGGRKVVISRACADKALPTLLGMGVNYTPKLDNHDAQKKIGIIDGAEVRTDKSGPYIHIEGFIYASDFPDAAARIRADKDVLGFSFECRNIVLADPGADPLVLKDCVFTGAAILRKDKAAFMTTALAARAEGQPEEFDMTPEELKALLAEAMKPTTDSLTAISGRLEKLEAAGNDPKKLAAANQMHLVEPHAKALEAAADGMCAAGIGGHETRGHAVMARKMAAHLRASAAQGVLPHIYRDHDFFSASGDDRNEAAESDALKKLIQDATKPLVDKIAAQGTLIEDLKAKGFNSVTPPERKSASAELVQLLAKGGLELKDDTKLTVSQADDILAKAGLTGTRAMEAKLNLQAAGRLAA
jgi:hypothetical protein